jgi:hypothetical protein
MFLVCAIYEVLVPGRYRDAYSFDKLLIFGLVGPGSPMVRQQGIQSFGDRLPCQESHGFAHGFQVIAVVLLARVIGTLSHTQGIFPEQGQGAVFVSCSFAQGVDSSGHGSKFSGKVTRQLQGQAFGQCRQFPVFVLGGSVSLFVVDNLLKKRVHLNFFFLSPLAFVGIRSGLATLRYSVQRLRMLSTY